MRAEYNRDPEFWARIAAHPEVAPYVTFGQAVDWSFVANPRVVPFASEHGGFLFVQLDGQARVFELHSLFTPEGWGAEVAGTMKAALDELFALGARLITTAQMGDNKRSRPPLSHGWRPVGVFGECGIAGQTARTWVLTVEAWGASPAKMRKDRQCPSY